MTPWFFGYGSLVNRATHRYPLAQTATLNGWRRVWVRTGLRDVVFLSIHPAEGHSIDGLIATVPGADWAALDQREHGYARIDATRHALIAHPPAASPPIKSRPNSNAKAGITAYCSAILTLWCRASCMNSAQPGPRRSSKRPTVGTRLFWTIAQPQFIRARKHSALRNRR